MLEHRDQNIRRSFIQKLHKEFDENFAEDDVKKEWNSHRRDRKAEKVSRSSGACINEMFSSD